MTDKLAVRISSLERDPNRALICNLSGNVLSRDPSIDNGQTKCSRSLAATGPCLGGHIPHAVVGRLGERRRNKQRRYCEQPERGIGHLWITTYVSTDRVMTDQLQCVTASFRTAGRYCSLSLDPMVVRSVL